MNQNPSENKNLFRLVGKDAEATGFKTPDGFLVLKGSIARKELAPSAVGLKKVRDKLVSNGVLEEFEDQLRFAVDYSFDSPSGAAEAVLGRRAAGWDEWTTDEGKTLDELERNTVVGGLNADKRKAIIAKQMELERDGKLIPESTLAGYYDLFRAKFGPEVLKRTEGEALLNLMHNQSDKNSLAYWLEFKNDEEFPSIRFGSIAGGSALKFGIYRRKATGTWQSADNLYKPQEITVNEAVKIAEKHRNQLIKGCSLLEQLPDSATDADYAKLQREMDKQAPDVSSLAWGHKYFSLSFPDKLDDFHSPLWQRFHLLKLLQELPLREGRYLNAGRFVVAAKAVGMSLCNFDATLNALHGGRHLYWRIGTRDNNQSYWELMKGRNCIGIGWHDLGDLSWVRNDKTSKKKLLKIMHKKCPSTPLAERNGCSQLIQFIAVMGERDIVLAADEATVLGIGRVTSGYEFNGDDGVPHQRHVEWLDIGEWKMPAPEGLGSTVREIKRFNENILEAERRIADSGVGGGAKAVIVGSVIGRIQSILDRKSQVVLYGPPGTGKTYWAEKAANELAATSTFKKHFSELSPDEQSQIVGRDQQLGMVRWCCFHPAYGYEDFLEGYRPHTVNGNVTFELRDGVFKKICSDAIANPGTNYYLLVDEINRGDIPRIFGELLTIIEKDKRGKTVVLPISQEVFFVPKNVFLIGTMNTADRSISLLDAALRRRFGFVELMPDGDVLHNTTIAGLNLRLWFNALNARIRQNVGRDARNLQIGHSFLMQNGSPLKDLPSLKRAIHDDILPLLEEYCYENFDTLGKLVGDGLVDKVAQRFRHELFSDGQEAELIQVLLEIATDPLEISDTSQSTTFDDEDEVDEKSVDDEPDDEIEE